MSSAIDFTGKVAIVSGAASGICRVILTRLAEAGAKAVIADLDDEWGTSTAHDLAGRGLDVIFSATDVRDSSQVNRTIEAAVERFGRVDILVHGAGVGVHKEIVDLSDEEWDLQIDVQLRGAFLLSRAAARQMIRQGEGGRIILIGSTSANNARPKSGPHAASKAAEIQLSRVMALELGRYGITSNVVSPGLTNIEGISRSSQSPEYQKVFVTQVPLGRLGTPDEIADAVLFIASDQARFITGQAIYVDGGYSAGKLVVDGPHRPEAHGQLPAESS
ncbi:MAG TPA: SDR family NAD(P)-dependent oxidoreductase [Thermomicrobiales bacterium]|nr:SDR family NAD(P)-dependent oxidoreductase [Thermomicrobiales bacterium]